MSNTPEITPDDVTEHDGLIDYETPVDKILDPPEYVEGDTQDV